MENNKIFNLLDKAIQILDRCWQGYKPVAGVKPYEAGSCEKEMATQSDLNQIQKVIDMLDKAIQFYDPNQPRDASGRWGGGGGGSGGGKGDSADKDQQEVDKVVIVNDNAYKTIDGKLHHSPIKENGDISQEWSEVDEERNDKEGKMQASRAKDQIKTKEDAKLNKQVNQIMGGAIVESPSYVSNSTAGELMKVDDFIQSKPTGTKDYNITKIKTAIKEIGKIESKTKGSQTKGWLGKLKNQITKAIKDYDKNTPN